MNQGREPEHRRFTRVNFDAQLSILAEGQEREAQLGDISLKGALTTCPSGWTPRVGESAELKLTLAEGSMIDMQVTVAHHEEGRIGFHCEAIDVESISHLRKLVELNLGDADLVNRELAQLGEG